MTDQPTPPVSTNPGLFPSLVQLVAALAAVNQVDPHTLLSSVRAHAEDFYRTLAAHTPTLLRFLAGW